MASPKGSTNVDALQALEGLPFAVIGGIATRAYMPERSTKDLDVLVTPRSYREACARLGRAHWVQTRELIFPNTGLALRGSAWGRGHEAIDLITSDGPWVDTAVLTARPDPVGMRVVDLPYLILMKLDSGRVQDTSDISRMLALADDSDIERARDVIRQHGTDSEALRDLDSLLEIGRWELDDEGPGPRGLER